MVASKKMSSASSSANTRPKGTVNTSKSAKENAITATQATMRSSATKKMTASNRPKPAAKPLQKHNPSSPGVKDAETAALLAKIAAQEAEIDKLKKSQASKPVEKKRKEIQRPLKITNLQADMGLADNKRLYSHCLATVRDVAAHAGLTIMADWRNRDSVAIVKVVEVAKSRNKQLRYYEGNWATYEILKRFFKNKRYYLKHITSESTHENDDSGPERNNKEEDGDSDGDRENDGDGGNDGDKDGDNGSGGKDGDEDTDGNDGDEDGDRNNEDEDGDGNDEDEDGDDVGDGRNDEDEDEDDGGREWNRNEDNDNGEESSEGKDRGRGWNGKGKGKDKEENWYGATVGTKRSMPQSGRKSKIRRL